MEKDLEELKEKGKGGKEEFKQKYEEAKAKAKAFEEEFDKKLKEKVKNILSEIGVATKEDLAELKKLIEEKNK
jgi:polyhydroxyalkanoate synthesis regulator phasin